MKEDLFKQQLDFIKEIDKVKSIYRKSKTFTGEKYENDAEHSWHICLMAMTLAEYANEKIDILKVIKMLLIHDIVEIDAGDTFLYAENRDEVFEKEKKSAERIFGLLPNKQFEEFMNLWLEFENKNTPESKFAGSLDRLHPMLSNYINDGATWKENNVSQEMVHKKNRCIEEGSQKLWEYAKTIISKSTDKGFLKQQ